VHNSDYLDYLNVRPTYVSAWWDLVNWPYVEAIFDNAIGITADAQSQKPSTNRIEL